MNTRINLQPIAAPSILGLYAFAGSTLMVAANMAGWYGNSDTALYLISLHAQKAPTVAPGESEPEVAKGQ